MTVLGGNNIGTNNMGTGKTRNGLRFGRSAKICVSTGGRCVSGLYGDVVNKHKYNVASDTKRNRVFSARRDCKPRGIAARQTEVGLSDILRSLLAGVAGQKCHEALV